MHVLQSFDTTNGRNASEMKSFDDGLKLQHETYDMQQKFTSDLSKILDNKENQIDGETRHVMNCVTNQNVGGKMILEF